VGAPGPENQAIASATARGAVPLVLEPGLNVLYLHFGRTLGADSSWQTDRSENPTVELVYAPRYRGL